MNPILLCVFYLAAVTLPLALSWLSGTPPRSFWDEIATGAGTLAFAMILIEFVLSGRFRSISRQIGMDVTMRLHQLFARTALVLAILHPFLYRAAFAPTVPWDPTRQLTLTTDLTSLFSGIVAWVLLGALVLLSIRRDALPYTYEAWRWLHGLSALAIAGLLLHHTLEAGRYAQNPALARLWVIMFCLSAFTLAWVYVIKPASQLARPWRVKSVTPQGLKNWQVTLEPDGHPGQTYEAGQFAWLNTSGSPFSLTEHPFSISSAPGSGRDVEFIIKELGDATGLTGRIAPGSMAYLDGPFGHLVTTGRREPGIALIAGGVGIAPILGILRQLEHDSDPRPQTLIYANRAAEQIACQAELEQLAQSERRTIIHVLTEPPEKWSGKTGLVDAGLIAEVFADPATKSWLYILCGPVAMMEGVEDALIAQGVPSNQILSERFQYD